MVGFIDIEGSLTSPNIGNYYIGRGIISIKLLGETEYVDAGNCPTFEFTAKVTQLDHYSSRTGVRIKDFIATTQLGGDLNIVLEEWTARNMGFALLGLPSGGPSPAQEIVDVFSSPVIYAGIQFVGDSLVGPNWTHQVPLVQLTPSKALSLIGNTWGTIDLKGDVLFDYVSGTFGTAFVSLPNSPTDIL